MYAGPIPALRTMPMKTREEQKEYQRLWIAARRSAWIEENGPCRACGGDYNLEVDHIDPSTKLIKPSAIWSRREEIRNEELAKCQVLCEACHLEKTVKDLRLMNTISREHGTYPKYEQGCKCELCMEAMRIHWRKYRKDKKNNKHAGIV